MAPSFKESVHIKKYRNRRYYDASQSQHVTLRDINDLVHRGQEIVVTDSHTGEDITNLVLLQVLLEQDPPKLEVFPSSILHAIIRSNQQTLRTLVDQVLGPMLKRMASSQQQEDSIIRDMMRGKDVSPVDRVSPKVKPFHDPNTYLSSNASTHPDTSSNPSVPSVPKASVSSDIGGDVHESESDAEWNTPSKETIADLQAQLSALADRIDSLKPDEKGGED